VAAIAAMIGEPARYAMLQAVLGGASRPAGELAHLAGISPATASRHLSQLVRAGLLTVRPAGRHRHYALAGPQVAAALEALAVLAQPVPVRSLRQARSAVALRQARRCYDHLAGRAGVALRTSLLERGALVPVGPQDHRLTTAGRDLLGSLGIDPDEVLRSRRMLARECMDWTERRPHLAGALPAALLERFLELDWLRRRAGDRGLQITYLGQAHLPLDREALQATAGEVPAQGLSSDALQ
jgi:DNA-binding transcriptional ArsR family regulator